MKVLITIFTCLLSIISIGQNDKFVLERTNLLKANIPDTTRARIYMELADYLPNEADWVAYNNLAYQLAERKLTNSEGDAKKFYLIIKASATGNRGYLFDEHGDKTQALKHYFLSMQLYDQAGDELGKASILSNIGVILTNQGDYQDALDYLNKSLKIKRKHHSNDLAKSYLNIGVVYEKQNKGVQALEYYQKALSFARKLAVNNDIATALNNIGSYYYHVDQYDTSVVFLKEAKHYFELDGDDSGVAWAMANIGNSYFHLNQLDSAYLYCVNANLIAERLNIPELTQSVAEKLAKLYAKNEDWKNALKYERVAYQMKDSLQNTEVQKNALKEKLKYDHNLELQKKKIAREKERKIEQQRYLFGGIIIFILTVLSGFIYSRMRKIRSQKKIIENQKETVELKNKEILSSITYAKRLQEAIIPTDTVFKSLFPDSFIVYKPRDIVAGDFYWIHETEQHAFIVLGDCTGHGVPGAIVSVVCAKALDLAVKELHLIETNEIFDKVREEVCQQFQAYEKVNDGMDAVICRIDKQDFSLQTSGAMNNIWIKRLDDVDLEVIKGDRQPIGQFDHATIFSKFNTKLRRGDQIYLFTDGYPDQFGGDKERKFGSSNLKKFIQEIGSKPMHEQKVILEEQFTDWKGKLDQVDDVSLIGIRI